MPIPQEIHSLWNRPESLLLTLVQDLSLMGLVPIAQKKPTQSFQPWIIEG